MKSWIHIEVPVAELSAQDSFMQQLMELIRERVHDPNLSVNDLHEELGMSRSQFFRKIKAVSDVSPNKLILNVHAGSWLPRNGHR